jgi:hypothetical protein
VFKTLYIYDFNTQMFVLHYYSFEFMIIVQSKVIDLIIMYGLIQKKWNFYMLYVIFGLKFDIHLKKLCEKIV